MGKKIVSIFIILMLIMGLIAPFQQAYAKADNLQSSSNGLTFSHEGGFYEKDFSLELMIGESGASIYYTLDGSDPDPINNPKNTIRYTNPIEITPSPPTINNLSMMPTTHLTQGTYWAPPAGEVFRASIVVAKASFKDGSSSSPITHTYFVDKDITNRYTLPVISIAGDKDNLFDEITGIYVNNNWKHRGEEWERPMHIEFFEPNGMKGFSQNIGVRIHGGWTRNIAQKSLRIYARNSYDSDEGIISYDLFPDFKKQYGNPDL